MKKKMDNAPRGKPKSGRVWKSTKSKFSLNVKTKGIRDSLEKKEKFRQEMRAIKEASRSIIEAKRQEQENRKQRRREKLQKQEENRKKSEVVQVITNTSKIKRMKKKQLRNIEKRDILNTK
ncbi:hypothetical protein WA026_017641 [Henosepilachna vigintioctopunctata]|uniref:Coiled-coil domain-containing protein 86 n=1 Tax=Henosepilachna vigintioctopunctata TaxID=420089 RepID=A0AAW1V4C8_9CUCU